MKITTIVAALALTAQAAVALDWPIKGQDASLTQRQTLVAADAAAWQALWSKTGKDGEPAPDVDFTKETVTGEFPGDGSYSLSKAPKAQTPQNQRPSAEASQRFAQFSAHLSGFASSIAAGIAAAPGADLAGGPFGGSAPRTSVSVPSAQAASGVHATGDFANEQGKPLPGSGGDQGKPLPGQNQGKPLPGGDQDQGKPLPGGDDRYRPRPDRYHQRRYQPRDVPYDDGRVDTASYWQPERDFIGFPVVSYGNWQQTTGRATIARGGSETGLSQGAAYTAQLKSTSYRNVYRLYWRWIGRDCDPNDSSRCADWDVQNRWFFEGTDDGDTAFMNVDISFRGDKPLLPWEKENFTVSYDGGRVSIGYSEAGYEYSVQGPYIDQQSGSARLVLTPSSKRLNSPESEKVGLYLAIEGSSLKLYATDARSSFYSGEPLDISVEIKKDSGHWYKKDAVIFQREQNGPIRTTAQTGVARQLIATIPAQGSGKYYIKGWSFRRADSKISGANWIWKGGGNSVQY